MLENYRTYYNFIWKHSTLNRKKPSEVAGIDIAEGKNRWLTLIRKAIEE